MPHIEFDLDAKKLVPKVARALGVPDMQIGWGLTELWEWCWYKKAKTVNAAHLAGFFGVANVERLVEQLTAFEFLDSTEDTKTFLVRGAVKRLGVSKPVRESRVEAGRRGGKASAALRSTASNLKQNASKSKQTPKQIEATTEATTEAKSNPLPPFHPSTGKETIAGGRPPEDADAKPGWKELVDALFVAFGRERGADPEPLPRDWKALKTLRSRAKGGDAEILVRWGRGLRGQFKTRVDSFRDLDERWDALAADQPNGQRPLPLHREPTDDDFRRQIAELGTTADGEVVLP